MKLTEENVYHLQKCNNEDIRKVKQILDDYEKARKWEEDEKRDIQTPKENQKLRELIEKLPIGLILQHIRDSFSEDKPLMLVEAQMKTTKCIEDLMEIQKLLQDSKK